MTEGTGTSDSNVSIDKTNGVSIQNTDLAITGGNIGVTNGNMTLTDGHLDIIDENSNSILKTEVFTPSSSQPTLLSTRASSSYPGWTSDKATDGDITTAWSCGDINIALKLLLIEQL